MIRMNRMLAYAGVSVFAVFGASSAFAAGTAAGTSIDNKATVNYTVGSVAQTPVQSNTDSIIVDRKVDLLVSEVGSTTTSVVPGQTAAVTTFTVKNQSNATIDIGLAATQAAGGTAIHGGTDAFDGIGGVTNGVTIYVDTNGNGVYDAGTDTAVTYLDELAADLSKTVFIVTNIPTTATNGQVAGVTLTGTAQAGGTANSPGAVLANDTGANTSAIQTVLADTGTADGNVAGDGKSFARDDYTVATAVLTVAKSSTVLWDPINGTNNPKAIPGAVVEYCIKVTNTGPADATGVAVSDPMPKDPANPTVQAIDYYSTVSANAQNGNPAPAVLRNVDADASCANGTSGGSTTGTPAANNEVVGGTLSTVTASSGATPTRSFRFRAVIR